VIFVGEDVCACTNGVVPVGLISEQTPKIASDACLILMKLSQSTWMASLPPDPPTLTPFQKQPQES
jgi:hypothetical protein